MKNEDIIYLVINRFFSFYTLRINMARSIFFVLLNTNRKRSTQTNKIMTKKMKREKSHIYKKKDMDIHCEDNKQRDFCFA
jgi:hypothetical protein